MGEAYRPLRGLRVLDLSRLIVGALATRHLADMGAEVVKVEAPGTGDYLRSVAPFLDGEGVWHHLLNRNKESIALDLGDPGDREVVRRLAGVADVVVDVSRPGALARLGLDPSGLRRRHPALVVCSITGFGQEGPWSLIPAHGLNMDSLAGAVATADDEDGIPRFVQLVYSGLSQESPALQAALAIVSAVHGARAHGEGAWIDVSCWDAVVEMNRTAIAYRAATGRDPQVAERHMWGAKHRIYRSADGRLVFLAVIEQKFWELFCDVVHRPDLRDAWQSEGELDYGGGPELEATLEEIFAGRPAAEWGELFTAHGLPGSPLLGVGEVMESEQFAVRGLLEENDGPVPNVASPIRWLDHDGTRPGQRPRTAPSVGADTDEVLATWLADG